MRKKILIVSLLAILISGVSVTWNARGAGLLAPGEEKAVATQKKKGGNAFGNFFRSLGRMFGGGKKKAAPPAPEATVVVAAAPEDKPAAAAAAAPQPAEPQPAEVKLGRISKKDQKNFETKHVTRAVTSSATAAEATTGAAEAASGAASHLERGRALLSSGNHYAASEELAAAVALDPASSEAHNLLGVALNTRGWHERAIKSFKRALKLAPEDAQILNNLGYSYYLNNEYSSATKYLKRAAQLAPGDGRVLNNLAVALNRAGKNKEALESFVRAGGEYTGRMNMAALMVRTGRYAEAAEHYEEARRLRPGSAVVLERLAELYGQLGRPADAQQALRILEIMKGKPVVADGGRNN